MPHFRSRVMHRSFKPSRIHGIARPRALLRRLLDPRFELGLYGRQIDEEVLRLTDHGCGGADAAARLYQLRGIQQLAALLALIASRVRVPAVRARTQYITVSEKPLVLFAVGLAHDAFRDVTVLVQLREYVLRYLGVDGHGGAAELVE